MSNVPLKVAALDRLSVQVLPVESAWVGQRRGQDQHSDNQIANSLIRVPDPDDSIYRIFLLWFFEEVLRLKQLVLVSPRNWEDPYEIIGESIAVDIERDGRIQQEIINQSLPPVFAQCWSATAESDTLLRTYSRVEKDPHSRRNTQPLALHHPASEPLAESN